MICPSSLRSSCSTDQPCTISAAAIWLTRPPTSSHIWPGPNLGYKNCSISEVSVDSSAADGESLASTCLMRLENGKPFDSLRAPFGADVFARQAPDLFGVGLEKREVEFATEAIDKKLFEITLMANGKKQCVEITKSNADGAREAQFA